MTSSSSLDVTISNGEYRIFAIDTLDSDLIPRFVYVDSANAPFRRLLTDDVLSALEHELRNCSTNMDSVREIARAIVADIRCAASKGRPAVNSDVTTETLARLEETLSRFEPAFAT